MTTTIDHPLAHLVPSATHKSRYISRTIDGVNDIDLIRKARAEGHNILLEGPTGPGKTALVYAAAAADNLPLVNVPCNGAAEPRIFIGGWTPQADGTFDFIPGDLILAVAYGGVIYLDEVNMLPPRIAVYLHGLLDDRRTVSIPEATGSSFPTHLQAHPDCQVIAACNPGEVGTRPMNGAFRDRFAFPIEINYDPTIEAKLLVSSRLIKLAISVRERTEVGDILTPLSTRSLIEFERFALDKDLGWDFALANLLRKFKGEERHVVEEVFSLHTDGIKKDLYQEKLTPEEPF